MELAQVCWLAFAVLVLFGAGIIIGRRHGANELIDRAVIVVETRCAKCAKIISLSTGHPVIKPDSKPAA